MRLINAAKFSEEGEVDVRKQAALCGPCFRYFSPLANRRHRDKIST